MTYVANMSYLLFPRLYCCINQTKKKLDIVIMLYTYDDGQVSYLTFTKNWTIFQAL